MTSLFGLAVRQVLNNDTSSADNTTSADTKPQCGGGGLDTSVEFNMGLHVGALFIILVTSAFGIFLFVCR
jgi:hypothetical protein